VLPAGSPFQSEVHGEHGYEGHGSNQLQRGFARVPENEHADNRNRSAGGYPDVRAT